MRQFLLRSVLHRVVPATALFAALSHPLAAQDSAVAATKAPSGKWSARIVSFNGISGNAEIAVEPKGDKESRGRLIVRSAPINRQISWDIVAGSCGDEGRTIAAAAAFRLMLTRNDGSGEAQATVPKLEAGKRYYVRVFQQGEPATDRSAFGCANLSES
ncbi:MAG TPA: hypothetical protein VE869_10310 [Gemmatimonas sp.]|nr:hypothetical protein [Gemmatimonas sp.]